MTTAGHTTGGGALLVLLACSGTIASAAPSGEQATPGRPRVEEFSSGPVSVTLTIDPPVVRLDRDTLLSVRITAPTNLTTALPPVESRVKGFAVAGSYDSPAEIHEGSLRQERHIRLTPQIVPEYRIAPLPIVSKQGSTERWFPTRPVVLEVEPLAKGPPGKEIDGPRAPVRIYPGFKTVSGYFLGLLALVALGYGIWWAARNVHRAVKLRRMSPRERAIHELAELLARDLIGRQQVKDFYFELTMIVRRYIERAHAIRAPEQTTEEFLLAVSQDPRFSREVVSRLRAFLEAADRVKYAAYRPDEPTVNQALSTAKTYIETDAEDHPESGKNR
jgi:hypothetical protein